MRLDRGRVTAKRRARSRGGERREMAQPQSGRETRIRDAPVDGPRPEPDVGSERGREDDEGLEVDCVPPVAGGRRADAELAPLAPGELERQAINLLTEPVQDENA